MLFCGGRCIPRRSNKEMSIGPRYMASATPVGASLVAAAGVSSLDSPRLEFASLLLKRWQQPRTSGPTQRATDSRFKEEFGTRGRLSGQMTISVFFAHGRFALGTCDAQGCSSSVALHPPNSAIRRYRDSGVWASACARVLPTSKPGTPNVPGACTRRSVIDRQTVSKPDSPRGWLSLA
jgi:hypothetical protein